MGEVIFADHDGICDFSFDLLPRPWGRRGLLRLWACAGSYRADGVGAN